MVRPALKPTMEVRISRSAGFSLILMSVIITVGAIIMVSYLPGNEAGDSNAKTIDDIHKLETVEEHMRSFMAFNRRRPCPADGQYQVNSSNFGREAAIAGTCQGGTPNAPLGPDSTGYIVAGTIPTRSLGLDTSYAFDSYGRPFTYVVDIRATSTGTCDALEGITTGSTTPTGKGGLYIDDGAGNQIDQVMYAYISHGPSGYGAFPDQGSTTALSQAASAARRINSGSTDLAMQINAGVAAGANPGTSTFTPTRTNMLVRNSRTLPSTTSGSLDTGFDDLVWYRDDIKNTCCLGVKCIPLGFRIDGQSASVGNFSVAAIGDINGDGIPDLVLENAYSNGVKGQMYVIFGTSNMGSSSSSPWPIPPTGFNPTTLNGKNGFIITNGYSNGYFYATTVADINGDGYADIITESTPLISGVWKSYTFIIFGGPGGAAAGTNWIAGGGNSIDVKNLTGGYTGVNGTSGVVINTYSAAGNGVFPAGEHIGFFTFNSGEGFQVADINGDGYKDLIQTGTFTPGTPADAGFVIFGMPSGTAGSNTPGTWSGTPIIDATTLNGSNGFQFYSSDSHLLPNNSTFLTMGATTGDFDHDGYNDILISGANPNGDNGITSGGRGFFLIYGRPNTCTPVAPAVTCASWQNAYTTYNGNTAVVDLEAELMNGDGTNPNRATEFYVSPGNTIGTNMFVADLNGDGAPDLLVSGTNGYNVTVIYGKTSTSRWPRAANIYSIASTSGQGFYLTNTGAPGWIGNGFFSANASAYDVNGDGKLDLLLAFSNSDSPLGRTNPGSVLVVYQPSGGWSTLLNGSNALPYSALHWDGTDSFQIYGPKINNAMCDYFDMAWAADVRPGDHNAPEILISCQNAGENSHGSVYGVYKNKGWPSSIDLNQLN